MDAGQLNLFDPIDPTPQPLVDCAVSGFEVGDRIQIISAGTPLQHMNGQKGEVIGLMPDAVSVQVEGVAVALMFRPEALERRSPVSEYTTARDEAEAVVLFRVGDRVECHSAFVGQVGTVRRIGMHCAVTVAWVDYGERKPLYPSSLEYLSRAE
jgi:ribosomal protein L21E